MDDLGRADQRQRARILALRRLGPDSFVLLTEVVIEGAVTSPGAVMVRLEGGMIVEATAYLSDVEILEQLEVIPPPPEGWTARRRSDESP